MHWGHRACAGLLAMTACGGPVGVKGSSWVDLHDDATSGPSPSGSTFSQGSSSTSEGPERWPDEDDDEDESSGSMPGVVFLLGRDLPRIWLECDIFDQACPPGEKCVLTEDEHGNWTGIQCKPILGEPAAPGEPCTVLEGLWSGIDSCDVGGMCWYVDDETLEGTCIAFCVGDESNLECEDPDSDCAIFNSWPYAVCIPQCDPLLQDCPDGQACYPLQAEWSCVHDASGDSGGYGDPCEFINVCDPGYICLDSSTVPPDEACEGAAGCCTAICDVTDPLGDAQCEGAAGGQTCQPWYEEGAAPPGYEDVGACALPA